MPIRVLKKDKREIGRRGRDPYAVQPRKPSLQPSDKPKPGIGSLQKADIEKNNKIKQVKAKYASLKETARDELTPMKSDRVFSKFRRPDSAKEFYADKPGSKYEGMAKEAMQNRINYYKNMKRGGLSGGQKKLDKNKDGKITGEDFKMMKAKKGVMVTGKKEEDEYSKYVKSIKLPDAKDVRDIVKKKAKGGEMKQGYGAARQSGMGLQDENLVPGKVQKAFLGLMIKGAGKSIGRLLGKKKSATAMPGAVAMSAMSGSGKGIGGMLPKLLQKAIDDGIIKPASKGRMMKASKGGGADMGRMGEIKSKLALAKDKFKRVIGSRPNLKAPERGLMKPMKKMGGGMMQRPMGYSKGTMVMARGCKLGRKKATKLY